jgi:hypothetical protein
MKLKEGFLLREIAGKIVVLPCAEELNLNLMLTLNGTGRFLWEKLESGATAEGLVSGLMEAYDVPEDRARQDVTVFVEKLTQYDLLA